MDINKMGNMLNGAFDHSHHSSSTDDMKRKRQKKSLAKKPVSSESTMRSSTKSAATVRPTSSISNDGGMIPWSLALDYRSIGILDALEKLYGLSNRDEALQLLFQKPLRTLIQAKGVAGKKKFELNRKVYDMNTRPKAIARHQKFGR